MGSVILLRPCSHRSHHASQPAPGNLGRAPFDFLWWKTQESVSAHLLLHRILSL